MKQLSSFTENLNSRFGSTVAIPKGRDYGYLRRLFGNEFESVMTGFKTAAIDAERRSISDVSAISYSTGYNLNSQPLYFIDYSFPSDKNGLVHFESKNNLPSVKFTKVEFESFALFHEIGHSLDRNCRYFDLEENGFDCLAWQKECFADFYASLVITKALGSSEFINDRLIPLRTLETSHIYHTIPAIKRSLKLSQQLDMENTTERDLIDLATSSWNEISGKEMLFWRERAKINHYNLSVMKGCIEHGSIDNFLENIPVDHHQQIVNNFGEFMKENLQNILMNTLHFNKPTENICKLTYCLLRPISDQEMHVSRNKTHDRALMNYFSSFPECQITAIVKNCQNTEIAI